MLNGGIVNWKSSKQEMIIDSIRKANYIVASDVAKEAVWIKKFMTKLGVVPNIIDLVLLYYDNNRAIMQAKEPVWIKKFMTKLGVVTNIVDLVLLYYDNNEAIMQAKEPRSHQRSKHVLHRYHIIW